MNSPSKDRWIPIAFSLTALLLLCVSVWQYSRLATYPLKLQRMASWEERPAAINCVQRHRTSKGKHQQTRVLYQYEVDGTRYLSRRLYAVAPTLYSTEHYRWHDELSAHVVSGEPRTCYVNPVDPTQAVLYRHLQVDQLVSAVCYGTFLLLCAAISLWLSRRATHEVLEDIERTVAEPQLTSATQKEGARQFRWFALGFAGMLNLVLFPAVFATICDLQRGDFYIMAGHALWASLGLAVLTAAIGLFFYDPLGDPEQREVDRIMRQLQST